MHDKGNSKVADVLRGAAANLHLAAAWLRACGRDEQANEAVEAALRAASELKEIEASESEGR